MSADLIQQPMTDAEYIARTNAVLASVEACIDAWLQDDVIDIDAHRTGGLLEMRFPNGSMVVLNTQPPLHELWMAARAGGFHFKHVGGLWLDRDGHEFFDTLSASASAQAGVALKFANPA